MNLIQNGLVRAFRGLRTGDPRMFLMGAGLLMFGWLRRSRPSRRRVYRRRLREGESVVVRYTSRDAERLVVERP